MIVRASPFYVLILRFNAFAGNNYSSNFSGGVDLDFSKNSSYGCLKVHLALVHVDVLHLYCNNLFAPEQEGV